jgi:S-DNA-T family DNA segregation ATPase FtsK/SpoIIIE
MARKKATRKDEHKSKKASRRGLSWVWWFILLAIILALLLWQSEYVVAAVRSILGLFGWGLVFIVAAIITLVVMIKQHHLASFIFHWNRWLGGIAFILVAWGILACFRLGGGIGREIINYTAAEFIWVLRLLALVIIGIVLVAPRGCFHAVKRFFVWVGEQFKRQPAPRPSAGQERTKPIKSLIHARPSAWEKPAPPKEMEPPLITPEVAASKATLEALAEKAEALRPGAVLSKQDLRQVAQDVWKKYGQSAGLVTIDGWRLPPIDILDMSPEVEFSEADNIQRAKIIEEALASYGVEAKVVQINAGPTVTQFGVEPGWDRKYKEVKEKDRDGNVQISQREVSKTRVKVERITSLSNDMALALAAPTIRIEAPVPGKSMVGIEVPNKTSNVVSLRGVVETSVFQKLVAKSRLAVALGKGAGGESVAADLTKMPHLLIAGATGSGKTVCLNTIICCLLMHNTPNDVRFIMVDPKRVEMTQYNSIPIKP